MRYLILKGGSGSPAERAEFKKALEILSPCRGHIEGEDGKLLYAIL
jgi:hypothetical protein